MVQLPTSGATRPSEWPTRTPKLRSASGFWVSPILAPLWEGMESLRLVALVRQWDHNSKSSPRILLRRPIHSPALRCACGGMMAVADGVAFQWPPCGRRRLNCPIHPPMQNRLAFDGR